MSCSSSSALPLVAAFLVVLFTICCQQQALAFYDRAKFKEIVYNDNSNDDAIYMNAQQLLIRSGFSYEEHYSIADDGYITQLIRIINPLADRTKLKSPPVMLFHGASIDQAAYLVSSSIQHHPEPYPRTPDDGPMTSSNRSLGFMLANHGYDVWLIGQRGSNRGNQGYTPNVAAARALGNDFQLDVTNYELIDHNRKQYWSYGLDDVIKYEIDNQIDKVLEVTGAEEVSVFSFSLSTPTTMAFLAGNPDYARRVRVYTQMAPAIAADHLGKFDELFWEKLCPVFPTRGIGFVPTYWTWPAIRKLITKTSYSPTVRYSLIYKLVTTLFGRSQKYQTNLERNLLAHIFQPVSFKSVQHYCQNSITKQLSEFDYGEVNNIKLYMWPTAPLYDISKLNVQNWVVISGTNDALADATTVARLIERTSTPKPPVHIIAPGFNHLDFQGAVECDKYVNLPYLEQLDMHADSSS